MDKLFRKGFELLRNLIQFLKIFIMFCIMMFLLYWIQNLIGSEWTWMDFIKPVMEFFVVLGSSIYDGSVDLFGTIFEYKYITAVAVMIVMVLLSNWLVSFVSVLEDKYDDGYRMVKKISEDKMNSEFEAEENNEQKKIRAYKIYVGTSVKKKFSHQELNVNLEEQNRIMNKFLIEKTGTMPQKYGEGFLYSYNRFDAIDSVLKEFFKLIKSNSPLDYCICIQAVDETEEKAREELDKLISLKIENKLCMLANTAYRYKFNSFHGYGTTSLGVFQKDDGTCEVHEFIEIL